MQAVANPRTLIDVLVPQFKAEDRVFAITRNIVLMLGFASFVALSAQIAVRLPWTTVPITVQTFAVLVTGGALGMRRGAGALTIYMLMGITFLPVFAPGSGVTDGSWDLHFILPWEGSHSSILNMTSGGYIVGFILAAGLTGYLAERGWDRKQWVHLSMFLGNAIIYVPGLLWLGYLIATDWIHPAAGVPLGELIAGSSILDKTLVGGLYPFIVGDMMKLFLASLTLPTAWALAAKVKPWTRNS